MIDAVLAVFPVKVQDRFGIAMGLEFVAACDQFFAVICMVIDLAVIDDHAGLIVIEHRLVTVSNVDDAQPPVAEAYAPIDK
jgi:hypothetical protein